MNLEGGHVGARPYRGAPPSRVCTVAATRRGPRATKRPSADSRRWTAIGGRPARTLGGLGPWYESGQVMRPWTVRLKMHTYRQRVPKMSGSCQQTARTGAPLARPAHRPARWGRSWSGRVHVGRWGEGWCEAVRTDEGPSPDRWPMDLPATKAQRSARAYHRCATSLSPATFRKRLRVDCNRTFIIITFITYSISFVPIRRCLMRPHPVRCTNIFLPWTAQPDSP